MMKGWSLPKRKKPKRFLKWKEWLEPWKSVDQSLDAEFGPEKREKYSPYVNFKRRPIKVRKASPQQGPSRQTDK